MATRYVGAREANQQFSALLKAVEEDGVTVVITRRGRSVVQMQRVAANVDPDEVAARMDALFEKYAKPMGVRSGIDRESLHDRSADLER